MLPEPRITSHAAAGTARPIRRIVLLAVAAGIAHRTRPTVLLAVGEAAAHAAVVPAIPEAVTPAEATLAATPAEQEMDRQPTALSSRGRGT